MSEPHDVVGDILRRRRERRAALGPPFLPRRAVAAAPPAACVRLVCTDRGQHPQRTVEDLWLEAGAVLSTHDPRQTPNADPWWMFLCPQGSCHRKPAIRTADLVALVAALLDAQPKPRRVVLDMSSPALRR